MTKAERIEAARKLYFANMGEAPPDAKDPQRETGRGSQPDAGHDTRSSPERETIARQAKETKQRAGLKPTNRRKPPRPRPRRGAISPPTKTQGRPIMPPCAAAAPPASAKPDKRPRAQPGEGEGRGDSPAGDGATGEDKKSPPITRPIDRRQADEPLYVIEEHSDLLSGMLASVADDCRRRAVANRQSIKARFRGHRLQDGLAAARRLAAAELAARLAMIRRDYAPLRGSRRQRRRAGAAHL